MNRPEAFGNPAMDVIGFGKPSAPIEVTGAESRWHTLNSECGYSSRGIPIENTTRILDPAHCGQLLAASCLAVMTVTDFKVCES